MVAAGWTEAQKRAYVLADNQLAITGSGWDPELLRLEFGELKLTGFDGRDGRRARARRRRAAGNCCLVGALDFVSSHHAIKGDAAERYLAAAISDERGSTLSAGHGF
jgi:hypothetical protein